MPATATSIYGTSYLSAIDFRAQTQIFGVEVTVVSVLDDQRLFDALAMASRCVEAYAGRSFASDARSETHPWDWRTRRVYPFEPPVTAVTRFRLRRSADGYDDYATADIYINNTGRYLELAPGVDAQTVVPGTLNPLHNPMVELVYTGYSGSERDLYYITAATGMTAATLLNDAYVDSRMQRQLMVISQGQSRVQRQFIDSIANADKVPPQAKMLLDNIAGVTYALT